LKKQKLLFLVNVDWAFLSHRLPLAIELIKQGYEVHIATAITDKLEVLESSGLVVHPIRLHRSASGIFTIYQEFVEFLSVIRAVKPDLIHSVTIKPVLLGGIAARLLGVSALVSAVPGLGFVFISRGVLANIRRQLTSALYRVALGHKNQCVIFQNQDDESEIINLARISQIKTAIIPGSGVDLSLFTSIAPNKGMPIVLLACRLLVDKGVREFVHSATLVNEKFIRARFIVVGDPDPSNPATITPNEVRQWKKLGDVEFWGYRSEMHEILRLAHIVALPSYREGSPKVLIEAAACGRPVITTDVPGCRDVINENVTGLLVPARSAEGLSDAISLLLDNSELRENMGRSGRELAEEKFDIRQVVSRHMQIYEDLLAKVRK